jgi:hypothetical protein
MLVVIPALTSQSIDKNILPGIAKALERYYLIWHLDEILPNLKPGTPTITKTISQALQSHSPIREQHEKEGSFKLGNFDTLGLEPTYITVKVDGNDEMIGAKVVFFPIKGEGSVLDALLKDLGETNKFKIQLIRMSRALVRLFSNVLSKIPIVKSFFGKGALTGDVYKDVILEKSSFGGRVILCLNTSDIEESKIEESGAVPKRLFKLGWKSMVICNDIVQSASFCMEESKGVCYTVPYSILFSVSKTGYQVYTDQSDLKKRSSPFFSRRSNVGNVFRECESYITTSKYLNELKK